MGRPAKKPKPEATPIAVKKVESVNPPIKRRKMDFGKPHAVVMGAPGAHFQQDGVLFNREGLEVIEKLIPVDDSDPAPLEDANNIGITPAVVISGEFVPLVDDETQTGEPGLAREIRTPATMSDIQLQACVEAFGGEWVNRKEALKFLAGKPV